MASKNDGNVKQKQKRIQAKDRLFTDKKRKKEEVDRHTRGGF